MACTTCLPCGEPATIPGINGIFQYDFKRDLNLIFLSAQFFAVDLMELEGKFSCDGIEEIVIKEIILGDELKDLIPVVTMGTSTSFSIQLNQALMINPLTMTSFTQIATFVTSSDLLKCKENSLCLEVTTVNDAGVRVFDFLSFFFLLP